MTDQQTSNPIPIGAPVAGAGGELLGHVGAVFADNATGRLAWAAVQGRERSAVVPLERSWFDGATLHIPFGADHLRAAPVHDPAALISYEEGDELARHYGLIPAAPADPNVTVTRSEERLRADTVDVIVGRARLVTYVVTEEQTFTIPVRRQEVRLVYDAVPEDQQVVSREAPSEYVHEVVLHSEQVVFTTRVVPVERVRMVRRVVTAEETVSAALRSEQIEMDQVGADNGRHHEHRET